MLGKATQERPLADAALLTALLHLTAQEYDAADVSFAAAAATDPARADIYYFWGKTCGAKASRCWLPKSSRPRWPATNTKTSSRYIC